MRFPTRHAVLLATVMFLAGGVGLGKSVQIHGRVLSTPDGEPLPGVELSVYRPCDQIPSKRAATTVTRNNGEYELTGVKPGRYRLEFFLAGYGTTRIFDIYLHNEMEPLLLDVGLEVGSYGLPSPETKIEGSVTDADGKPLADATMTAQTLHLTGRFLQVRTNSEGRYSIRSPAFDDIIISAAKHAYQPAAKAITLRGEVTLVDFSLQPSVRTQANAGQAPPNTRCSGPALALLALIIWW